MWFSYDKATELLELNDVSMGRDEILSTSQRDMHPS